MVKIKKFSIIFLILLISFSAVASADTKVKIENMNFSNASVVNVLRAIAEVADVNLITDSSVAGTTTVHLKDITFQKALDLITQTRGLDYKWDENTIVVAAPERIESIYTNIVTEFVTVNSNNIDDISVIIKDIFPDTQITVDNLRRQFILKGEKSRVDEIKEMITRLDTTDQNINASALIKSDKETKVVEEKIYTESFQVVNAELADLENKLKQVNFNLDIRTNALTNKLTIKGSEKAVKEAISMAKTYDQSLEPATRVVRVDYVDSKKINEIVSDFYPDIKLHVNEKRKEIIINGAKNKLDGVAKLVKEINIPQDQVMIEIRVEEISSGLSREIGIDDLETFSTIEFEKDADDNIDGIDYNWPELFKLLDKNNDSVTLANPRLMTLNGEEATMSILEKEPYQIVEINDNNRSETYEYAEAGVEMTFTPWITENDEVELSIAPEVSDFTRINPDLQVPPAISTRSVETKLRLKDGEMFAVGGLIKTEEKGSVTKIPLLGDLPIVGELFKSRLDETGRTEIIIFVRPKIIKYGEEIDKSEHLVNTNLKNEENIETENTELVTEADIEENEKEEILAENNSQSKKEIIEEYKNKSNQGKGFQNLTDEELQEILNN